MFQSRDIPSNTPTCYVGTCPVIAEETRRELPKKHPVIIIIDSMSLTQFPSVEKNMKTK